MYKKSLLSVAIASTLTLTGCLNSDVQNDNNASDPAGPAVTSDLGTYPMFDPINGGLPIPNDLIFDQDASDGTFDVDSDPTNPAITAIRSLSGASTVAPIDIPISGLIDAASVDGAYLTLDASGNPIPNPLQNVFLIETAYASGSPLQGLSAQEPPTAVGAIDVDVEVKTLSGTSYIRLNPKTPLKPNTRYVVAVTNEILDTDGDALVQAPGAAGYAILTDLAEDVPNPLLDNVKALINGLWEPLSVGYFDAATNMVRAGLSLPDLTEDNIALSYSFTTSNDEKVLNYIADPAQWFSDQITTFVGVSTATSIVTNQTDVDTDGDVDYTDVNLAVTGAIGAFPVNPSAPTDTTISDALDPLVTAAAGLTLTTFDGVTTCSPTMTGTQYIECASAALVTLPSPNGFADLLPTPAASPTITVDTAGTLDGYQVSSLTASLLSGSSVPPGTVSVTQGTIEIPYYLGQPVGANGAPIITDNWEADDTLATAINAAFAPLGLQIPQADPSVTTVVNYIFPFPKNTGNVTIPFLAIHPTTPTGEMRSVIYQHGITTDRSAALGMGVSMVAGALGSGVNVGVIAIDQPLHGIDGINTAEKTALAESLLSAAGSLATDDGVADGIDADEQATLDAVVAGLFSAGVVQGVDAATNSGAGGATNCIDLATNGLTASTASVLGGACDADPIVTGALGDVASTTLISAQLLEATVAEGSSTIPGLAETANERHFGFTASSTTGAPPVAMDYDGSAASNRSGSMFINLLQFLTSRDNGRQQVLDLLTLRKSLGAIDLNGAAANGDLNDTNEVYFIGHSLGTLNGMPFVAVANDSLTTTDDITAANFLTPGGGLSRLFENSPVFSPQIVGGLAAIGLTQDTADFQSFLNVFQHALDSVDPINFVQDFDDETPVLFTTVVPDTFIPASLDEASEVLGDGSISFLAGSDPLLTESDSTALNDTPGAQALTQNSVTYIEGTHETPVFPSTGTLAEQAAFAEMVGQATSMIVTSGTAIVVDNTSGIDVLQ